LKEKLNPYELMDIKQRGVKSVRGSSPEFMGKLENQRIRRKSCMCERCGFKKQRKGDMIVLDAEYDFQMKFKRRLLEQN